jgi:hypothetical protein
LERDERSSLSQITLIAIYHFRDLWKEQMISLLGKASWKRR